MLTLPMKRPCSNQYQTIADLRNADRATAIAVNSVEDLSERLTPEGCPASQCTQNPWLIFIIVHTNIIKYRGVGMLFALTLTAIYCIEIVIESHSQSKYDKIR